MFVPLFKMPGVFVEIEGFSTMVQVETTCNNENGIQHDRIWKSQSTVPGTYISAENLLLSFAIFSGGGCASKVI